MKNYKKITIRLLEKGLEPNLKKQPERMERRLAGVERKKTEMMQKMERKIGIHWEAYSKRTEIIE